MEKAIDNEIAGDQNSFADVPVKFAHEYGSRPREDPQIFANLFRNGPVYGLEFGNNVDADAE